MDRWMDGGWMAALATTITAQTRRAPRRQPATANSHAMKHFGSVKSSSHRRRQQLGRQAINPLAHLLAYPHTQPKARLQLGHITIQTSSAQFMLADEMCLSVVFHSLGWTHFGRHSTRDMKSKSRRECQMSSEENENKKGISFN